MLDFIYFLESYAVLSQFKSVYATEMRHDWNVKFASFRVLVILGLVLLPSQSNLPPVKAANNVEVSINEWNYRFDRYGLDFNQSTYRTSWTHKELKDRVPFYEEVLGAWPISIRLPKQVYVPKDLPNGVCFTVPVQIRAEVDLSYLKYRPSPIEIEFWPRVVMQGQTLSFQGPNLTVGPQDWLSNQKIIEKLIPICVDKQTLEKNITGFFINTNLFYSRLFSEFDAPKAECWAYTIEACKYIGPYGGVIEVVQGSYSPVDEGKGFEATISQLKEYLLSVSSLEKQNIELAKRNLAFAESELTAATLRAKSLTAELEAKAKAKAEAEAKAQAEAKAKAEAEAKCLKNFSEAATLRTNVTRTIGDVPTLSKQLAKVLESPVFTATCPESFDIAILSSSFELIKLEASSKRTTITCVKGKTTKKVTAVKPKCPSGYKKK